MLTHDNIKLSSVVAALYGLTADNANVDKALARTMQGGLLNALLTEFTKTSDSGDILATDSLLNALNKLNNQSTAVGMYTGNDAETRDISIGFTPRCIIIIANSPAMTGGGIGLAGTGGQGSEMWSGIVAYGYPLNTLSGRDIPIKIVENGFTVGKKDTYYAGQGGTFKNRTNFLNITYNYIALR